MVFLQLATISSVSALHCIALHRTWAWHGIALEAPTADLTRQTLATLWLWWITEEANSKMLHNSPSWIRTENPRKDALQRRNPSAPGLQIVRARCLSRQTSETGGTNRVLTKAGKGDSGLVFRSPGTVFRHHPLFCGSLFCVDKVRKRGFWSRFSTPARFSLVLRQASLFCQNIF